jgi:hypothetical protein
MSRIGPPGIYRDKFVPFQLQLIVFQRLGDQQAVCNLAREKPEVLDLVGRYMLMHGLDDFGCRDRLGVREALQER